MNSKIKKFFKTKEAIALSLAFIVFIIASVSGYFFIGSNIESLIKSVSPYGIMAIGMMVLLIAGVFDLSIGSVMCLGGLVTAICLTAGMPILIAILIGLAAGAVIGLINGLLVEVAGINPLITTIGLMYIARGISEIILSGRGKAGYTDFDPNFLKLGTGKFLGIYYMFWIMLVLLILVQLYLRNAPGGRRLYYIGGNAEAAMLMGINKRKIVIAAYILSGVLAALAGILETAYAGHANRYTGQGAHMNVIIATIIGGGSLSGGQGSMYGAFFGTLFMALLTNAFNLHNVAPQWQSISVGIILVAVVAIDGYLSLRKQRALGKI